MGQVVANPLRHGARFGGTNLRQDQSELVTAEARGGVDVATARAQNVGKPAKRSVAYDMPVLIVDPFEAVHVKKQKGKPSAGALAALQFRIKDVCEAAVIGKTCQGI